MPDLVPLHPYPAWIPTNMKSTLKLFLLIGLLCSSALGLTAARAALAEYVLGSGDVLKVTVYQNPDLTTETRVSESGVVTFPLLGSVKVGGLSIGQAEKLIADGLRTGN